MLLSITAVHQLSARQHVQHGIAFEVMNTDVVRMTFLTGKIVDTQNQIRRIFRFFLHTLIDPLVKERNRLVMHALYGTCRRLLHPSTMRSRGPKSLFDGMSERACCSAPWVRRISYSHTNPASQRV